jgi:purine-binding chemotaxis protein CheW
MKKKIRYSEFPAPPAPESAAATAVPTAEPAPAAPESAPAPKLRAPVDLARALAAARAAEAADADVKASPKAGPATPAADPLSAPPSPAPRPTRSFTLAALTPVHGTPVVRQSGGRLTPMSGTRVVPAAPARGTPGRSSVAIPTPGRQLTPVRGSMAISTVGAHLTPMQGSVPIGASRALRERVRGRTGTVELLLFRLGEELFGMELTGIEEAIDLPQIRHVPEMPPAMLGVITVRGSLTSIYSPEQALGVTLASRGSALIFRRGAGRVALVVDDVDDVFTLDLALLRDAPGLDASDGVLLGVVRRTDALLALVDAEALIAACQAVPVMEIA